MEKHQAIVFGLKVRVIYEVGSSYYNYEVRKSHTIIDDKVVIFDGFIDNPPLEIKEKIYIKDIGKNITISDKSRNLDGGYVYSTYFIKETIEDEETEKSKVAAEIECAKKIEEHNRFINENNQKENKEKYDALPFYKKWFTKSV